MGDIDVGCMLGLEEVGDIVHSTVTYVSGSTLNCYLSFLLEHRNVSGYCGKAL